MSLQLQVLFHSVKVLLSSIMLPLADLQTLGNRHWHFHSHIKFCFLLLNRNVLLRVNCSKTLK